MQRIAEFWDRVEGSLFPHLRERLPVFTEGHKRVAVVLELLRIEECVPPSWLRWLGRKPCDRKALARAFVVKACYNLPTTKALVERLHVDETLRRMCGFERRRDIPSESTFSRAFAEFAKTTLPDKAHEVLVKSELGEDVVWHVSRDSVAVEARERRVRRPKSDSKKKEKRSKPSRLERQWDQSAAEAIAELPTVSDTGAKLDSKGHKRYWFGYKFHVDVGDSGVPLSAVTTSASLHDSQAAIPLAKLTAERVTSWYDLMDAAYDSDLIHEFSRELGHVPIIPPQPRRGDKGRLEPDRVRRFSHRTSAERFFSRFGDCGGDTVRVRGKPKVHTHLMFGLLVVFAEAVIGLLS